MRLFVAVICGVVACFIGVALFSNETRKIDFDDLSDDIKKWYKMGKFAEIHGKKMFYIMKKCSNPNVKHSMKPTFVLIHGFPSSSYEYHKVLDKLSAFGDVIVNDHVGFGFSDIPTENYTYSLAEAAENLLALWRYLGLKKAHIISHDMGDSVLTEILARRHRDMLPQYFDGFFQSVTFTNGGMNFKLINMRIGQKILMYKKIGSAFLALGDFLGVSDAVMKKQLQSIWSPDAEPIQRDKDIEELMSLNTYTGADKNVRNTIFYLWDRYHFEFRWFAALAKLDMPSRFIWGDSDSVAPVTIPKSFENMIPNFNLALIKNKGHFWMLEDPDIWVKEVIKILEKFPH